MSASATEPEETTMTTLNTDATTRTVLGAASRDRSIAAIATITPAMFDDAVNRLVSVSDTLANAKDSDLAPRADLALRQILMDLGITVKVL